MRSRARRDLCGGHRQAHDGEQNDVTGNHVGEEPNPEYGVLDEQSDHFDHEHDQADRNRRNEGQSRGRHEVPEKADEAEPLHAEEEPRDKDHAGHSEGHAEGCGRRPTNGIIPARLQPRMNRNTVHNRGTNRSASFLRSRAGRRRRGSTGEPPRTCSTACRADVRHPASDSPGE